MKSLSQAAALRLPLRLAFSVVLADRGRRSPSLSQGQEPGQMIGSRPADLIEANDRWSLRPNGWQQPRPECQPRQKPLRSGRRPWMGKFGLLEWHYGS